MRWRKIRYALLSFGLILYVLLTGCDLPTQTDYFAYRGRSFTATVRGELCRTSEDGYAAGETDFCPGISGTGKPLSFAATVTVQPAEQPGGQGTVTVCFSEPTSLQNLTVCRKNGTVSVTLGEVTVSDARQAHLYDGLLRVADVWLDIGDPVSVVSPERGSIQVKTQGERGSGTFLFEDGVALPRRVTFTAESWSLNMRIDEKK